MLNMVSMPHKKLTHAIAVANTNFMVKIWLCAAMVLIYTSLCIFPLVLVGSDPVEATEPHLHHAKPKDPHKYYLHSTGAHGFHYLDNTIIPRASYYAVATLDQSAVLTFNYPPGYELEGHVAHLKFNKSVKPEILLIINSRAHAGKVLNFELRFDLNNDNQFDLIAQFYNYTTRYSNHTEEKVHLVYTNYTGNIGDLRGGWIQLAIWRTDTIAEDVLIYCGAYSMYSWVKIPYDAPPGRVSDTKLDNRDKISNLRLWIVTVAIIICACIVITRIISKKRMQSR
jgi:hypothetical protein